MSNSAVSTGNSSSSSSSSSKDEVFNFGMTIFKKVRIRPIVVEVGTNDDDDNSEAHMQHVINSISVDDNDKDCDYDDISRVPVILSNGQLVLFGLVVYPPHDSTEALVKEFCDLFEKYRDYLLFSYSLDDLSNDELQFSGNKMSISVHAPQTTPHHVDKSHIDLPSSIQISSSIRVQKIRQGVLITQTSKLQLRSGLIGLPLSISLSLILSLTAREHVTIAGEEEQVRRLLEMNRYHPNGIPQRKVKTMIKVIDSLQLSIFAQELNIKDSIIVLTLSNVHPNNAIFIYDATILLNHTRIDWKSSELIELLESIQQKRGDADDDDFDDNYSEALSDESTDDFFPAHLFFDIKLVSSKIEGFRTLLKIEPGISHNLVFISSLKDVTDSKKLAKLPATQSFITPCVVEWSHLERASSDNKLRYDHANCNWSCSSNFMSCDHKKLISQARQEGLLDVGNDSNKIKVSFHSPEYSYVGVPIELMIKLLNISEEEIGKFYFSFQHNPQTKSIPFIVHENSHIIHVLRPGESKTIKMTILPLSDGPLVLDGFKIRSTGDCNELKLAHVFQMHIFEA